MTQPAIHGDETDAAFAQGRHPGNYRKAVAPAAADEPDNGSERAKDRRAPCEPCNIRAIHWCPFKAHASQLMYLWTRCWAWPCVERNGAPCCCRAAAPARAVPTEGCRAHCRCAPITHMGRPSAAHTPAPVRSSRTALASCILHFDKVLSACFACSDQPWAPGRHESTPPRGRPRGRSPAPPVPAPYMCPQEVGCMSRACKSPTSMMTCSLGSATLAGWMEFAIPS